MEKNSLPWSRQQRTGVLALLFILIVLFVTWRLLPALWPPGDHQEEEQLVQAWLEFKEAHVVTEQEYPAGARSYAASAKDVQAPSDTLFFFDPNTVSEANLTKLGLPPHTVRTILKYRNKRGRFYKVEDLQKLYTLAPSDYRRLAPYVRIAAQADRESRSLQVATVDTRPIRVQPDIIDLNQADAATLRLLRGIGPVFSERIIRFRDALGGFVSVTQLQEVYGLPDSTYQQIKGSLRVTDGAVRKLPLNEVTETELAGHAYIDKRLAGRIIALRRELGGFTEISQIKKIPLINEEKYRKIAPYLSLP